MISESPVVTVHIPPLLRPCVGGTMRLPPVAIRWVRCLKPSATNIRIFATRCYWRTAAWWQGLTVYLGPTSVRKLQGLATPVQMEELVSIVPTGEPD
jgi:hypothetical protein